MESLPIQDFLTAINAKSSNPSLLPSHVKRISLDSRTITRGDVFWAIRGTTYDGHQFVESALEQGATAAVVDQVPPQARNTAKRIHVENTLSALQSLARWHRSRRSVTSIGITGSFGKTTTRELLHAVLSVKSPSIQNEHNYNNEIGVPLTVLNLLPHHQCLVVEMGAAKPGDIRPLTEITQPQIGIITGIGPAHLTGFGSIDQIIETKGDLMAALPDDGFAVLPGENSWTEEFVKRSPCPVLTVGFGTGNTFSADKIEAHNDRLAFQTDGCNYQLPMSGRHHVTTGLIVVAVAKKLGYSSQEIQQGFDRFTPPAGRGRIVQQTPWAIIDDTYNANPASCHAACEMLAAYKTKGRRILILGDMLELGEESAFYHEQLGKVAARSRIDIVFTLGQRGESIHRGVSNVSKSPTKITLFDDSKALGDEVSHQLRDGDVVLVKGSRGMRMERILERIVVKEASLQLSSASH